MARRELAKRHLSDYQTYVHPWFKPSKVHKLVASFGERWLFGEIDHLMLLEPVRHGKSQTNTIDVTSFGMGKYPDFPFMVGSYSGDLARDFGRKILGTIRGNAWRTLFPGINLSAESHAVDEFAFELPNRGVLVATGRQGAQTGKGWIRGIIDDPTKDWEEAISSRFRQKSWEWVQSTFMTRAEARDETLPGIMLNMCMTGDTPVMMQDGSEVPLRDIRAGDKVSTYEDGNVTISKVVNWANQGIDIVYEVTTKSGRKVKANARHPFRVINEDGEAVWVRLGLLKVGMKVRSVTGPDEIIEIVYAGEEDVFDIEVERTHNFIANGLELSNTHWHEDDIAGRFIKEQGVIEDGGIWTVVRLPIEAEEEPEEEDVRKRYFSIAPGRDYSLVKYGGWRNKGDALWPERYPLEVEGKPNAINAVVNIKKAMGSKIYTALYMQRPTMESGDEFQRTWFNTRWSKLSDLPPMKFLWGEIDTGLLEGRDNDRSAFIINGLGFNGLIYGIKGVADVMSGPQIYETAIALQEEMDALFPNKKDSNIPWLLKGQYIENAALGAAVLQFFRKDTMLRIYKDKPRRHSKLIDFRMAAVYCERGMYIPPSNEMWWEDTFFPEILGQSASGNSTGRDDCVDVFSRAVLRVMGKIEIPNINKNVEAIKKRVLPTVSATGY